MAAADMGDAAEEEEEQEEDEAEEAVPIARKRRPLLHNKHMADRMQKAADARRELYETFALSDGWLLSMIVGFSVLGNTYPVKRKSEIYTGVVMFCLCFGVYVILKSRENARKPPKKQGVRKKKAKSEDSG